MAQQLYDPDADEKYNAEHLKAAEHTAAQDNFDREFNDIASNYGDTAEHPLGDQETAAADSKSKSIGNPPADKSSAPDTGDTLNYTGGGKKKSILGKVRGLSTSKKWLLIGGSIGGGGTIALILLLFILASSLKIPDLVQNITTYEFARLTRQYSESADRVTTEKIAADALDDGSWKSLVQDKYAGLKNGFWDKFSKFSPSKVMSNLESEHNFQLHYSEPSALHPRPQLIGVTLGDQTDLKIAQSAKTKFIPGLSSLIDFKNDVSLAQRVRPGLNSALDAGIRGQDIGPIIRGVVAKKIRQQLGIGLIAWNLSKFQGKTPAQADIIEAQERSSIVDKAALEGPDNAVTKEIQDADSEAKATEQKALTSDTAVRDAIKAGGVIQSVKDAIGNAVKQTNLDKVVGFVNPFYSAALPACIVYDGSLDRSGPTIDQQTTQQQAAYYYLASAADKQKIGAQSTDPTEATELGLAAGATSDSLGDINKSNAMIRANGGTVDTSNTVSAETSAGGEYTLLNATPGISAFAGPLNTFADKLCPQLTSLKTAAFIGVAQILVSIGLPGEEEAINAAGDAAASLAEDEAASVSTNLITRAISSVTSRTSKLLDISKDTVKSASKITLMTIAAKILVNERAGQMQSGMAQNTDLANQADSGANIQAGMLEQQQMYGRPMTQSEIAQSDQSDQGAVEAMNSSKSIYERYLATDNSFSLLSRMAMGVSGNMNSSFLRSLVNIASTLLHPLSYFGSFATSLNGRAHAAATDGHYGNVQFGWSEAEESLIDSNESYSSSLENQYALDNAPQMGGKSAEDYLSDTYGKCFTDSIGTLLSEGYIQRDSEGNVLPNKGDCAPNKLGPNSTEDCGGVTCADWVFRWRLAMQYDNTLNQLTGLQDVTD